MSAAPPVLWRPSAACVRDSNINRFIELVNQRYDVSTDNVGLSDSAQLYEWSVREPAQFWNALWDFAGVVAESRGTRTLVDGEQVRIIVLRQPEPA